jgi:hypothetical protein
MEGTEKDRWRERGEKRGEERREREERDVVG